MAEAKVQSVDLEIIEKYPEGVVHDMQKYFNIFSWNSIFSEPSVRNLRGYEEAKKAYLALDALMKQILKEYTSKEHGRAPEELLRQLGEEGKKFDRLMVSLSHSKGFPKKSAELLSTLLPRLRISIALSESLGSKMDFRRRWIKVNPLIEEMKDFLKSGVMAHPKAIAKKKGRKFSVSFNIKGNPIVLANKLHLRRALFNIFYDAIRHSLGYPVRIDVDVKKGSLMFRTTSLGRKVPEKIVRGIGRRPYSTDTKIEPMHGYGKIAARGIILAHGGSFTPENQRNGFAITANLPHARQRKAV